MSTTGESGTESGSEGITAIIGSSGQVGQALFEALQAKGRPCVAIDRQSLDLMAPTDELASRLDKVLARTRRARGPEERIRAVILAAAFTEVDRAETDRELALQVNARAPQAIARYCARKGLPLAHFSTDYVFSGEGEEPWREDSRTAPLNAYGESKLAGERAIQDFGGSWLIFRTSWVFAPFGRNFLLKMLELGKERESVSVVDDQWGSPTYAPHLAEGVLQGLDRALSLPSFPSGIYHLCGRDYTTWHGFASRIVEGARSRGWKLAIREITPVRSSSFPAPARRPHNSRLSQNKAARVLGVELPSWQAGVDECLDRLKTSSK